MGHLIMSERIQTSRAKEILGISLRSVQNLAAKVSCPLPQSTTGAGPSMRQTCAGTSLSGRRPIASRQLRARSHARARSNPSRRPLPTAPFRRMRAPWASRSPISPPKLRSARAGARP
jgi:hypothetical protein